MKALLRFFKNLNDFLEGGNDFRRFQKGQGGLLDICAVFVRRFGVEGALILNVYIILVRVFVLKAIFVDARVH